MWLQPEEPKVALYAALGNAGFSGYRAHAPVRRAICGFGVQRRVDQLCHAFVVDRARCTGAHVVVETSNAPFDEA
ncbi:hypothetical protein D3C84_789310 [compost metagenome]